MELEFGNSPNESLKRFVNRALDQGEYFDGFEVAIKEGALDYQEYEELFVAFQKAYGKRLPKLGPIKEVIEKYLPQMYLTNLVWTISKTGAVVVSDGLRVAMIDDDKLKWVTNRISWDGVRLSSIENDIIIGEWYSPIDDNSPWNPLKIAMESGELIEGEVIEH